MAPWNYGFTIEKLWYYGKKKLWYMYIAKNNGILENYNKLKFTKVFLLECRYAWAVPLRTFGSTTACNVPR